MAELKLDKDTKVQVELYGTIYGQAQDGETAEEAQGRLLLEAETRANAAGDIRLHLWAAEQGTSKES